MPANCPMAYCPQGKGRRSEREGGIRLSSVTLWGIQVPRPACTREAPFLLHGPRGVQPPSNQLQAPHASSTEPRLQTPQQSISRDLAQIGWPRRPLHYPETDPETTGHRVSGTAPASAVRKMCGASHVPPPRQQSERRREQMDRMHKAPEVYDVARALAHSQQ